MGKKKKYGKVEVCKKDRSQKSRIYMQAESKHSLEYYYKKKSKKAQAAQASQGNASQEVVDVQDDIDEGDVDVMSQGQAERNKELSRKR